MATRIILRFQQILTNVECRTLVHPITSVRACSSAVNRYDDRDPAPLFFNDSVQKILKRLTGADFDKVFRRRMFEKRLEVPKYEFLTEEELQEHMKETKAKAEKVLQMPPVLKERQPIDRVLSRDPALTGCETSKIIFTDITFGLSDRKRTVLVRDLDGTLRHASWEERERLNQIYNPRPGRKLTKPKMFLEENLKGVISRDQYEFILDRACAQFDPDDPEYQRVCSATYEAVDERRNYQMLHSTRHYGPMCFYLAWNRKMDNLLIDLIQKERLSDCVDLVQLYYNIHKESKSASIDISPDEHLKFVKAYIEDDSVRRPQLQLAIQGYEDLLLERQQYQETLQTSHGL